ncbi:unnamed protein product [Closterium sp. NIES-53]
MAENIDVMTPTQDRLNELLRQLHESSEEIAALTAERTSLQNDVARAQQAHRPTPLVALPCTALPVALPCPALPVALPCPARRVALLVARRPALHVAPPCSPRANLPCASRCPAGFASPCPAHAPPCWPRAVLLCPHTALPPAAPPCPARTPPCWPPLRPAQPERHPCSLHEENWLRRPPGFTGSFPAGTQRSLRRPVYGLRQAPHECHDTLRMALAALGFPPSPADSSLFLRTDTSLPPFYILMYIDDLDFGTAVTAALALVKSELQKRHTCTDLSELRSYLGLQITWDRAQRTITLTQSHMVHQVLQRFGFRYSSPQSAPLPTGHSLSAPPSDESIEPSGLYPQLVGCLMYLMTCTRPDLAYPLRILARYVAPGKHRLEH